MNMKWTYKLVLGAAGVMLTSGTPACTNMTVRTVVTAKGNNKLHLRDVADADAHYVIDCGTFPAGGRLYRNAGPGDTIRGTYMANRNRIYLMVSPDTIARYVINCDDLPSDYVAEPTVEDTIIQEMTRAARTKQKQR